MNRIVSGLGGIRPGRLLLRLVLLLLIPMAAVLVGAHLYVNGGREVETDNAYVKADMMAVSAEVSGRVVEVAVHDNDTVEAGTLLFRIDPAVFEIAVAKARAQMDVVRTDVQSLRAEYQTTLREANEAREQIDFAARQLERQERLKDSGMSRADTYDEARHKLELARRQLESVQERTNRALANLAGNALVPVERHPRYGEAKAAHDAAVADLERTRVVAPGPGVVSNLKLQVGEHVETGVPIFSLIGGRPVWIEANFKETQLTHMRVGQPARVEVDAYPDRSWQAVVASIAPATGAEFAVLPPQNATGNWVKVVQRVPVRIDVRQPPGQPLLRAGMTVNVAVDTGRSRGPPRTVQRLVDQGYLPRFLGAAPAPQGD